MFRKKKQYEWTKGRVEQLAEECFIWLKRGWKTRVANRIIGKRGKPISIQTVANAFIFKNGKVKQRDCNNIYSTCIKMIQEERQKQSKEIEEFFKK